ncbi:putative major tail protein/T1SS secreted agglutinin RTX [Dickeya phage vB_DsoM_JA13]|uniref:Putative major tail protein/T1SS secreted agglutinin RTX n=1 Tax=Dickeya phage vB_DsoM_JA13 TaxID=2283030 RepID=A0A384ZWC6_9CAUD|nr:putative major tail protein/T1SS secreted agglutinin RTX [Dickeya phage vB_DsoM_JA13]
MATNILDFAKKYIQLARMRGLTPRNPINFEFKPYVNNQKDVYQMVVSYTEPSFADKPYNLLWVDGNPASPNFQKVLLRTSHISDGTFRGTWEEISDYANLYKSSQFFRTVVENAYDLGIDPGELSTPIAGTTRIGKVILKDNQTASIAVSSTDPRMSDKREPTSHDHADYPRTKIRINSKDYAQVDSSISPVAGAVLALVGRDPMDVHKYIGEWRKPSLDNVDWTSPRLLNLRISLPGNASYMSDNTSIKLVATAEWENNVVQDPTGVIWSIEENVVGVTIATDGTVSAPDLGADVVLKVTAKLKDPVFGKIVVGTYDLHIRNVFIPEDEIESITIAGKDSLFFRERDTYAVYALFKKGGLTAISPANFVVDNSTAMILTGMVGEGARIDADTIVTLTATYEYNGNVYTGTKKVTIKAQRMTELQINGVSSINSAGTASYTFIAVWSNGDKEQVTPDFFNAVPSLYTVISGNKVTAKKETEANRSVELQAGYTSPSNNQFIDAKKTITIVKEPSEEFMEDFIIQGADTIIEGRASTYRFLAIMNTGTNRTVDPDTFTSSNVAVAYIVSKTVNANQVQQDTVITLTATYTYKGYTRSATKQITIVNVVPTVALSSIQILGDSDVQQNSQHDYTVLATYSDGHTLMVQPDEFKMVTTTSYASFDGATGRLTVGTIDIPSVNISLSATYTENGITKNATKSIVARGNPATKVRIEIVGPSTIDEGATGNFTAHYLMSDNTTQPITNLSWLILQGGEYATIDSAGLMTAKQVTQDQTVLLRASDGEMNSQASVIIRNKADVLPESLSINGPTDIVGGNDTPYTALALFTDASSKDVTQDTEWSVTVVSGTTVPSISKGVLSTTVVSSPSVVRITAVYRLESAVVTQTRNINVLPADVPTAYGPRYGTHTKVMSMSGYDKAFFESLKTNLTETGTQILNIPAGSSTEANKLFWYAAWPARLAYGYFKDPVSGFAGSWDGAKEFDDFNFVGGVEVTIDGVLYYVYRADFPFGDQYSFSFELTYGSKDPLSGMP